MKPPHRDDASEHHPVQPTNVPSRQANRPLHIVGSLLAWLATVWLPWWSLYELHHDEYVLISAMAQFSAGAVVVGMVSSTIVMNFDALTERLRLHWREDALTMIGSTAALYLFARAIALVTNGFEEFPSLLLVMAQLITLIYTPALVIALLSPSVLRRGVRRLAASYVRHEASLIPVSVTVASYLILLFTADAWAAMRATPPAIPVALWTVSVAVSARLHRVGLVPDPASRGADVWRGAGRLAAAGTVMFVAFLIAGANLVPPSVAQAWNSEIVDPTTCVWWQDCSTLPYLLALSKLALLLTAVTTIAAAASLSAREPNPPRRPHRANSDCPDSASRS